MWAYGRHYRVERVDVKRRTFDCGVMVDFKQSSWASSKYKNIVEGNLQYVGKIQKILSWITALSNVAFLNVNGMKHLRGQEDMKPIVDCFL